MLKKLTVADQVASYLRDELVKQRWSSHMPGRDRLACELGVHGSTIERALVQLEKEGLIQSQGVGKRRRITGARQKKVPGTKVVFVPYEREDLLNSYVLDLQNRLQAAGHTLAFTSRTMRKLKFDPKRIVAMMQEEQAVDAFIVMAGSRALLERLSRSKVPVFALFGRMSDLPLAGTGPDKLPALRECIPCLYKSGHRRIVMLTRGDKESSRLGVIERTFLEELEKLDLTRGSYNIPDWENSPVGLEQCLTSLFKVTPPSAILVDDWMIFHAIQNQLNRERGKEFRVVSCIPMDYHRSFVWSRSRIPHISWDSAAVVRRAVNWVNNIARGKKDLKQKLIVAKFINADAVSVIEDGK